MLYLKCTAEVQKEIGFRKNQLTPSEPSDALLGHWMVNRFSLDRQQAYVFMSESTLLSFILLRGKAPLTPQRLPEILLAGLGQLLHMRAYSDIDIAHVIAPYLEARYAQNDNRVAMGCMNDLVWRYQASVEVMDGLDACDLTELIFRINDTPQRTLGWANSWDMLESKLRVLS